MTYKLGAHSRHELKGVHPDMVRVVRRAIRITEQDFTVHDGLRTIEEQEEYVRRSVSKNLKSMHLPQEDTKKGHAVDLVPFINGKLRWELEACFAIAQAVRQAAREEGVAIRWGGPWARLDDDVRDPGLMVEEYVAKRRRQGRRPFVDAPHFELM